MLISDRPSRPRPGHPLLTIRGLLGLGLVLAGWGLVVALVVARLEPAQRWRWWAQYHGHIEGVAEGSLRQWGPRLPGLWLSSLSNKVEVPQLVLDIKFKNMQRLWRQRDSALALGQLEQGEDDYVPAEIRLDDRTVRVRLRLKGDVLDDYLRGGRWGFRIHVRGDDQILGMRRFSLQHPNARHYHGQVLLNAMARHEGILAPRYFFVDVTLNGDFLGRYALEEHFSKELLESQGRRESVIIKFDETLLWEARRIRQDVGGEWWKNFGHAEAVTFRESNVARSPTLLNDARIAVGLARAFAEDSLPASAVFDPVLMGRMIAIGEAWAAGHGNEWRNIRFYYNPITARLEPIAYDSGVNNIRTPTAFYNGYDRFIAKVLADSAIKSVYLETLARIAADMQDSASHQYLLDVQDEALRTLRSHYLLVTPFPFDALAWRASTMLAFHTGKADPTGTGATRLLHAYLIDANGQAQLELASRDTNDVLIDRMFWANETDQAIEPFLLASGRQPEYPMRIPGTPRWEAPVMTTLPYRSLSDTAGWELRLIGGQEGRQQYHVVAESYYPRATANPIPSRSLTEVLGSAPFLRWDEERQEIRVLPGSWRRDAPLIFPDGASVVVDPGTTIRFGPDAFMLVSGPMTFLGTADAPIRFEGRAGQTWQGIVAMPSASPSTWSHVEVRRTGGIDHRGWRLTGGVTFYQHPVTMQAVTFHDNMAEDALNLVHSTFDLREVTIANAVSDGLDADFSDGTVTHSTFQRIGWGGGGDAIDISGARVRVDSSSFTDIGDKALSAGEGSTMDVRSVVVDGAGAGAVAKDRSVVTIADAQLTGIQHAGLMAYIKKPEYGPAQMTASAVTQEGPARQTWVQDGSSIQLDGMFAPTEAVNVDSLYETIMRKGSP